MYDRSGVDNFAIVSSLDHFSYCSVTSSLE